MHSEFKIIIPNNVRYLLEIFEEDGYEAYIVGGCVRDSFIGKQPKDWDICTSATPDEVISLLECYDDIGIYLTGLKHGTVTARIDEENYEITTFRVDGDYSDKRRPDIVAYVKDVAEDLSRRDFTINAMAYSNIHELIDPFDGLGDINRGLIRCVRNPDDRFQEDALRILRALRFASIYGFKIEERTSEAIHRNKELLKHISAERIQSELCKLLCGPGVLDILLEYKDVIAVIIPELEPCIGFNQNNRFHKYDVYDHIAHAVASYRGSDISVKMALLLHDIGKPECYTEDYSGGHFHGHSVPGMRMTKDIMSRLRFDNETKEQVVDLVLYHDAIIAPTTRAVKRWLNKIGFDLLEKLVFVRLADINAHSEINQQPRRDKILGVKLIAKDIIAKEQCFSLKDLAVNGQDVMALDIDSGVLVGKILNHLLELVIEEQIENEHDALIAEAKKYLEGDIE